MSGSNQNKKVEAFKIPDRQNVRESGGASPQAKSDVPDLLDDGLFYVIDYEATNIEGVGRFVLQPQKIEPPQKDEIRDLFQSMRDISRVNRSSLIWNNRFYDQRAQRENAIIFYKQGMFMKDFTDNYPETAEFKEYYPCYQLMSYEQLRTYFTWRTEVRKGTVAETSLSYAFLYLYELLNNIGVEDPQDGLNKLMAFWTAYREVNETIDRYVLRWLKEYHIYYPMPQSFREFADQNNLTNHYPKMVDPDDVFDLFCAISKYNIRNSAFFAGDNISLISDCFTFVINKLRQILDEKGILFDQSIFQATKGTKAWQPFKDALFYPWMEQQDRRIVLSENEIYQCSQNNWTFSTVFTTESGRQFIGYLMKQIESDLRTATKYKYKLTVNRNTIPYAVAEKLSEAGLSLEQIVGGAVTEFYREATKTVVSVDHAALSRIRREALDTQEKLIVEEQDKPLIQVPVSPELPPLPETVDDFAASTDAWESLRTTLTEIESRALSVVLTGETELKKFADEHGAMLEVLVDGINQKAMDIIGDTLLDDNFKLYGDYMDQVKELVG